MKNLILFAAVAVCMLCACRQGNKSNGQAESSSLPYGVTVQTIDQMQLTTFQDNATEKGHPNRLFYGINNADSILVDSLSPGGEVASSISCFMVEKDGQKILFDAGLGTAKGGRLLSRMDSIGVKPEDIDMVFLTHYHGDHIGGMLQDTLPVFTRATVYAPQVEHDYWVGRGNETVLNLQRAYGDRLILFDWSDSLPLGILPMEAAGHTPGHTAYRLGQLFVVGDLMHGVSLQLAHPEICASYDMDREQSVAARRRLMEYARSNALVVAGMHLPGNGILAE